MNGWTPTEGAEELGRRPCGASTGASTPTPEAIPKAGTMVVSRRATAWVASLLISVVPALWWLVSNESSRQCAWWCCRSSACW